MAGYKIVNVFPLMRLLADCNIALFRVGVSGELLVKLGGESLEGIEHQLHSFQEDQDTPSSTYSIL